MAPVPNMQAINPGRKKIGFLTYYIDQENEVTCNTNVLLFHGNLFYTCMLCTDDC